MKVQIFQDHRYYDTENIIPDGTVLDVVKKWWFYGVLAGVHVIWNNRDIIVHMPDCRVIKE